MTTPTVTQRQRAETAPPAARLPAFLSGANARRALGDAVITVVGAGSVGSTAAMHLVRLGVGRITVVDPFAFKQESALTHLCPCPVGAGKAKAIARTCQAFPGTRVVAMAATVQAVSDTVFRTGVVILATDNLEAEVNVAERCRRYQTPLIQAAVDGETLTAQVRSLAHGAGGPCLACGYGPAEWAALDAARTFSCASGSDATGQPTRSPSFLCALAASMAAKATVLHLVGRPAEADTITEYRGFRDQIVTTKLRRRTDCPLDHTHWQVLHLRQPPAGSTVAELRERAGHGDAGWRLEVDGMRLVPRRCLACRVQGDVRPGLAGARFLPVAARRHLCRSCHRVLAPAIDGVAGIGGEQLPALGATPLRRLGVPATATVLLRHADRGIVLVGPEVA